MYRNASGYADPTAFQAISNIRREERRIEREKKDKTCGKRTKNRRKHGQKMESMGERSIQPLRPGV